MGSSGFLGAKILLALCPNNELVLFSTGAAGGITGVGSFSGLVSAVFCPNELNKVDFLSFVVVGEVGAVVVSLGCPKLPEKIEGSLVEASPENKEAGSLGFSETESFCYFVPNKVPLICFV